MDKGGVCQRGTPAGVIQTWREATHLLPWPWLQSSSSLKVRVFVRVCCSVRLENEQERSRLLLGGEWQMEGAARSDDGVGVCDRTPRRSASLKIRATEVLVRRGHDCKRGQGGGGSTGRYEGGESEKVKEVRQERSDFAEMLETQTVWKAVGFQKRSRVGYSMQKFARPVGIQWRSGGIQADLSERAVGRLKSQPRPVALRSIFFLARNMLWRRVEGRIGGQQVDKLVLGRL